MPVHLYYPAKQHKKPERVAVKVVQAITLTRQGIRVDGRELTPAECQQLSQREGFTDAAEMLDFYRAKDDLPFTGQLLGWTDLRY